jgi:hypothetical protein
MVSLLVALLLGASGQATGQMSPTSDVSGNMVKATGSTTPRANKDRWADVVNVKDYGAKGDGSTDDTAAIQAAINAALVNGSDVVVPPVARGSYYKFSRLFFQYDATYNPSAPSTSPQSRPVRLLGVGAHTDLGTYNPSDRERSILISTDAIGPALNIDNAGGWSARQIVIEGLTVIAENSTSVVWMHGANTGSSLRRSLFQQNGTGSGVDWQTTWMMGIEDVLIQNGANTMTAGSVGLRLRCEDGAGGGPIWAHGLFVQRAYQQKTTGTIVAGSSSLTLSSAIDFTNGQAISIQGAGTNGDWLDTTVASGGGTTTLTLDASAVTSVTAQPVRHGGGFDVGIQIGALASETAYDYWFSGVDFRDVVSQWNRTGIVIGGRPSAVSITHLWSEGNRQRSFFITNNANNVRIEHAYLNDLRASEANIVVDSATSGTAMKGITIDNVWFPNIHHYGIKLLGPTYTAGRVYSSRFTKHTSGTPGEGVGIYTGGVAAPWASQRNLWDTWSGLVAYDDSTKLATIEENDGSGGIFQGGFDGSSNMYWNVNSGSGSTYRYAGLNLEHGGVKWWALVKNNDSAGDFKLIRNDDSGNYLGTPFQCIRATGRCDFPSGGVTIGGGAAITKSLRGTAIVDVASIAANTCTDVAVTVTGAAAGADCVAAPPAALPAGLAASCRVSATDTVQVRLCNVTTSAVDPVSLTYGARVFNP